MRANEAIYKLKAVEALIANNIKSGTGGVAGERNGFAGVKILSDVAIPCLLFYLDV